MEVKETEIPGLRIIQPKVFGDARGFFFESYSAERYRQIGVDATFLQDNVSFSRRGILRGLHFQNPGAQGKLVQVLQGEVFDVAVDVRKGSKTFGKWFGLFLNEENRTQFWIPAGFAHGFMVTSETALFSYKCDAYYSPQTEYSLLWNDPDVGIVWPEIAPILSGKDEKGLRLRDFEAVQLPKFH